MRPYPQLAKHEESKPASDHPLFTHVLPVGMITADAPRFASAPGGHPALKQDLDNMGVQYDETEGHYGGPERSFLVYGLPREQLYALGKKYGQEAVIHNEGGKREFIYTNGPNEGQYHPGLDTYETWEEPPEDYYTKVPGAGYVRLHFDFDQKHPVPVMPPAPAQATDAVPPRAAAAPVTKHDIGYALYRALRKVQDELAQSGQLAPGSNSAYLSRPFPHPNAYPWHDGHTGHHYLGHGPGGVLISRAVKLAKHDAPGMPPVKHPHTDGAIPSQAPAKNDQAAGAGVKSYGAFALPFGHIDHEAKARGGSNLFHYDYNGKNDAVNKLVQDHGFQTYYAGGKFGKPDLANRNYNTKHLMVYDPTPQSGGDFGDQTYTDSWRKVHELAHALTYPEVNKLYGEGRRIGKLGHHRTLREALRAVHWEWLAAHKQRELNRSLGIEVPDETFNRETNTVMHDAAHRAVTGKFTEPSQEGFVPHTHLVPLETSLGMVREHARGLGLQGEHDLLRKSLNLTDLESNVADDSKFTAPEALAYLTKGARELVSKFEQDCLTLRKAETAKAEPLQKKSPPGRKKEVEDLKAKGLPASEAFGIAWKQHDKLDKKVLDANARDHIKGKNFALPGRRYPIEDKGHAEAAESMVSKYGTPAEKKKVDAAVHRKYPGLGKDEQPMAKGLTTLGPRGSGPPGGVTPGTPPVSTPVPPPAPGPATGKMLPGELAKHDAMCKCEGCGRMDHFAKGELKMEKNDFSYSHCKVCGKSHEGSKTVLGHGKSKEALAADTDASDREYILQRQKRQKERGLKKGDDGMDQGSSSGMADAAGPLMGKNEDKPVDHDEDLKNYNRFKDPKYVKPWGNEKGLEKKPEPTKKTELPAGASPDAPGEKVGEKKNNPVEAGVKDQSRPKAAEGGNDGTAEKKAKLSKAALPAGGAAAPKPPVAAGAKPPAMGGVKPGGVKLPKLPGAKPAAPAAPKTPPMGAGSPQAQVQKTELRKDLTWDAKQPATGPAPTPTFADGPGGSHGPGVARGNQGLKAQSPIMRRRKSAGALMDRMGAAAPAAPPAAPGLHPALAAAATPPPLPPDALKAPSPAAKGPKLPHPAPAAAKK